MRETMRLACAAGATALALCAGTAPAQAQAWFATECQQDFQDKWLKTLPGTWDRCKWFNQELNDTDLHHYYYNLDGAKDRWEDAADQWFMDDVDLLYASTHGGAWTNPTMSVWSMWNYKTRANSTSMRLGDESWNLSVLATYACETFKTSDGNHWKRLGPMFKGGLRFGLGSHDKVYSGDTTNEVGEDFADGLQKGKSFKYAWKDGNSDWWVDNDLTAMTTGANADDCHNRRANMKWQNFRNFPALRDGQIGWRCWSKWDDI
jgi:Family of unknown function (DUF6345)